MNNELWERCFRRVVFCRFTNKYNNCKLASTIANVLDYCIYRSSNQFFVRLGQLTAD